MEFSSASFLFVLLPATLLLVFAAPPRARDAVLLVASLVSYAWREAGHLPVLCGSVLLHWAVALVVAKRRGASSVRWLVPALVAGDVALLAWFKLHASGAPTPIPIGVSFYTFQLLGYVLDVSAGRAAPETRLSRFTLFTTFFPQLVAGPILRHADFAPQLGACALRAADFAEGVRRFVQGLAKKLLVADVLAQYCNALYSLPATALTPGLAWAGSLLFGLQIYHDFSGYSDMAVGLGLMFGFRLPENFRHPYAATSIRELWQRWHVTLTTWFRDYVLRALPRSRGGAVTASANIMIVFVLCGLWHGAAWHFVAWGAFHGAVIVAERLGLGSVLQRLPRLLRHAYVHLVLALQWPFFRCESLESAWAWVRAMLGASGPATPVGIDLHFGTVLLLATAGGAVAAFPVTRLVRGAAVRALGFARADLASSVAHLLLLALACLQIAGGTWRTFLYYHF